MKKINRLALFIASIAFPAAVDLPVLADGPFRPNAFIVRFYQFGFVDTNTQAVFEILNSPTGVDVDLSQPGSISVLANNVRPIQSGTYNTGYAVISNRYRISGNDGTGCYVSAGNYTISNIGGVAGYAAATNNQALAATPSNTAVLLENTFGPVTDPTYFGPATPRVSSTANNNVVNLTTYLTTAAQPLNINILGAPATRERTLFLGTFASPITISPSSNGVIRFTVGINNTFRLADGCTALRLDQNTEFGMSVNVE